MRLEEGGCEILGERATDRVGERETLGKISVENFSWFQNNLLENSYDLKILIKNNGSKIFMAAKLFFREQVYTKNFHQKYFTRNFLWLQNHFEKFSSKIIWSKFFILTKSFPGKQVGTQNFH